MSISSFGVAIPRLLFFLEAVQDEHGFLVLHGVDSTIGAAHIILDDLKYARTPEALEHLRCVVLVASLSKGQCVTEEPTHVSRQSHQVFVTAPDPFE